MLNHARPEQATTDFRLANDGDTLHLTLPETRHQALLLTTYGYGMRTSTIKFPSQKRYGSGVKGMSLTRNHGAVEALAVVEDAHEMFVIMNKGAMRVLRLDDALAANRAGRGRQIASLKGGEVERLLALVIPKVKGGGGTSEPPPPPPHAVSASRLSSMRHVNQNLPLNF
jgi:DNA gyrase/topoisomerase IV subunit A